MVLASSLISVQKDHLIADLLIERVSGVLVDDRSTTGVSSVGGAQLMSLLLLLSWLVCLPACSL
jgi:hypothetical protein